MREKYCKVPFKGSFNRVFPCIEDQAINAPSLELCLYDIRVLAMINGNQSEQSIVEPGPMSVENTGLTSPGVIQCDTLNSPRHYKSLDQISQPFFNLIKDRLKLL